MNPITDEHLERFDWYIVTDVIIQPPEGMYSSARKIAVRILTSSINRLMKELQP